MRDGVTRELQECVDDLLGIVSGGAGVPEGEGCHAVGVDVLGCPFQLRERGDLLTTRVGECVVDFEQESLVGLDDQRTFGHVAAAPVRIR